MTRFIGRPDVVKNGTITKPELVYQNFTGDGVLVVTRKLHAFSIDANSNLIYSTTTDANIDLQDQYGADIYEDADIGTNEYAYSVDNNGNLIVTYLTI
jgi:hypothetical protein